jgi:hypothetical protein
MIDPVCYLTKSGSDNLMYLGKQYAAVDGSNFYFYSFEVVMIIVMDNTKIVKAVDRRGGLWRAVPSSIYMYTM